MYVSKISNIAYSIELSKISPENNMIETNYGFLQNILDFNRT